MNISRLLVDIHEFIFNRHFTLPPEIRHAGTLSETIQIIRSRWPDSSQPESPGNRPVFILSAGWRSGSTLMQRLIMSSREIAVWGEPLGDAAFIARMGYCLSTISHSWPPDGFFNDSSDPNSLTEEWIANLAPDIHFLKSAQADFIVKWLGESAWETFGISRWGMKEVRLTIDHARYLKWLFPDARFIFVYRNPFDAYRSWKGNRWHSRWPGYYRNSAIAYGRHWNLLMDGFLNGYSEVDGILVKFEELISGKVDIESIARHVQVEQLNPDILDLKVRTTKTTDAGKIKNRNTLSITEKAAIRTTCGRIMNTLGY